jgi:hypothetical protein
MRTWYDGGSVLQRPGVMIWWMPSGIVCVHSMKQLLCPWLCRLAVEVLDTIKTQIPDVYPYNMPSHWPKQSKGPGGEITTEKLESVNETSARAPTSGNEAASPTNLDETSTIKIASSQQPAIQPVTHASSAGRAVVWLVTLTCLLTTTAWALAWLHMHDSTCMIDSTCIIAYAINRCMECSALLYISCQLDIIFARVFCRHIRHWL